MNDKQNKLVESVTKIIKLTQEGNLKWSTSKIEKVETRDDIRIDTVFICKFKNKILRLFKSSFKVIKPGPFDFFTEKFFSCARKYPYWESSITLEFIDDAGITIWTFPNINALNDLFKAVQYQVAGIDEFLNEILKD